ncbi:UNVERIFIED_CONTAM: hypothetical protein RMT77_002456 [Armadillidium vulgare]
MAYLLGSIFCFLFMLSSSYQQERCNPRRGECEGVLCILLRCGRVLDPFYCGCCSHLVCLGMEGAKCGGENGHCERNLTCDTSGSENGTGICVKCNQTDACDPNSCPNVTCDHGIDPVGCSCCPVCLKGPGENCSVNERCTFHYECKNGTCQEMPPLENPGEGTTEPCFPTRPPRPPFIFHLCRFFRFWYFCPY